jgi:hypothetical protein
VAPAPLYRRVHRRDEGKTVVSLDAPHAFAYRFEGWESLAEDASAGALAPSPELDMAKANLEIAFKELKR